MKTKLELKHIRNARNKRKNNKREKIPFFKKP